MSYSLRVEQHRIGSSKIDAPVRILLLSDMHLNGSARHDRAVIHALRDAVERAARTGLPDIVLFAGDYVSNDRGIALLAELRSLPAAGTGRFAVLGNHDYCEYPLRHIPLLPFGIPLHRPLVDQQRLIGMLESAGIRVLRNQSFNIETPGGARLRLTGLDEVPPGTALLDAADRFHLVLAHRPDTAARIKRFDLAVAGHTHGGIFLPGRLYLYTGSRIAARKPGGLQEFDGRQYLITRGCAPTRVPLMTDPGDICVLDIVPQQEDGNGRN